LFNTKILEMKKLRFVSLMVAALFMGFGFTSCEEDGSILATEEETDEDGNVIEEVTPEIIVNEGETDATTVYVTDLESGADEVVVTVQFLSSNEKMNRLYITENMAGAGAEKYELDIEDLEKKGDGSVDLGTPEEYELKFDIPFPVYSGIEDGTVEYQIWATSGRGDYRDMDKRWIAGPGTITINYGGENPDPATSEVNEYTAVLLAAPLDDGSSETFISVLDGEVYTLDNDEFTSYWDFGYYWLNSHGASLASTASYPALFDHDGDGETALVAIAGLTDTPQDELNNAYFAKSDMDFDAIENSSDLDGITKSSSEVVKDLVVGDVVEFVDNYGKKGLIKVLDVTTGYTGSITLDIKVQP
jgi:hypothetical protein